METFISLVLIVCFIASNLISYRIGKSDRKQKKVIKIVENKKSRGNQLPFYIRIKCDISSIKNNISKKFEDINLGLLEGDYLLFTLNELEEGIKRAKKNPEDLK